MEKQREIKFRAWDKFNGVMTYQKNNSSTQRVLFFRQMVDYELFGNEIIFMQFTGSKDKNGKEIYEGDILRMKCKSPEREGQEMNNYIDYFSGGTHCGFRLRGIKTKYSAALTNNRLINVEMEIMGNLYETPNLL